MWTDKEKCRYRAALTSQIALLKQKMDTDKANLEWYEKQKRELDSQLKLTEE